MKKLYYLFIAITAVILMSCGSDTTAEDWVGTYSGTVTTTERIIMTDSTSTDMFPTTITIRVGADDNSIIMNSFGEDFNLTIDGDKADLSDIDPDYQDAEGSMTLDGDEIIWDWKGTYLMDNEPYSEDTSAGTFTRQ